MIDWPQIVAWLAVAIVHTTPAACYTPQAEAFAVPLVVAEGYRQPQLAHELIIGQFITRGCVPSANEYASYGAALRGVPYFVRVFGAIQTFDTAQIRATWRSSLIQHYAVNHYAVRLPASWCKRGIIQVGDQQYC